MASRGGTRSAPRQDPTEWAKRLKEAKERAAQIKAQRASAGGDYEAPVAPSRPSYSSRPESVPSYPSEGAGAYSHYPAEPQDYDGRHDKRAANTTYGTYESRVPKSGSMGYGDEVSTGPTYATESRRQGSGYASEPARRDPYARQPAANPYGPGAAGGASHPGYRGMISFASDEPSSNPWDSRPSEGYQRPPVPAAAYPPAHESGPPDARVLQAAKLQQEANETFHALLRSDEGGPRSAAKPARSNKRPEWNSDFSASAMEAPSEAPSVASDFPAGSTAARLARMRAEMSARENNGAVNKQYAGIVEPASSRNPAASTWDDQPVGGKSGGAATWDEQPTGRSNPGRSTGAARGPASNTWDDHAVGGGSRDARDWDEPSRDARADSGGYGDEYNEPVRAAPRRSLARTAKPGTAIRTDIENTDTEGSSAPASSKLSLLKAKMRTGSARSLKQSNTPASSYDNITPSSGTYEEDPYGGVHSTSGVSSGRMYSGGAKTDSSPPQARARPAAVARAERELPRAAAPIASPQHAANDDEHPTEPVTLIECDGCGRKFNPSAIDKHAKVCAKVFQTKRKVFDSKAHALPDEALALANKSKKETSAPARKRGGVAVVEDNRPIKAAAASAGGSHTNWEAKSSQLREAMKAARQYKKAKEEGLELPPPVASAPDPSLIPCPNCGRSFNEKAAERHIPKCASIKAKPTALKKGSGVAAGAGALRETARPMYAEPPAKASSSMYDQDSYAMPPRSTSSRPVNLGKTETSAYARYGDYDRGGAATLRPSMTGGNQYPSSSMTSYGYAADLLNEPVPSKTAGVAKYGGGASRDSFTRTSGSSMGSARLSVGMGSTAGSRGHSTGIRSSGYR